MSPPTTISGSRASETMGPLQVSNHCWMYAGSRMAAEGMESGGAGTEARREVGGEDVGGVELDQGPGVLGPERGSEAVEQGGDLRLVGTTGRCVRHRVSPPSRAPRARDVRQAGRRSRLSPHVEIGQVVP